MALSAARILRRHRATLRGRLSLRSVRSRTLGIRKPYYVYEPPRFAESGAEGIVFLFRGHEREWVNMREDGTRLRSTAVEDLDRRIESGALPPVVAVMPGLASANNNVPSLGIDMVGRWEGRHRGLGTGHFWQYLTAELIPAIEVAYGSTVGSERLASGFSLGGYTVSLLAVKRPGYLTYAGVYDGLFMWPGHRDPRSNARGACTDSVWCGASIFDAALGNPRDPAAMTDWNPADVLARANPETLDAIRRTTFFVMSAPDDGKSGNVDRANGFVNLLRGYDLRVSSDRVVFDPHARHSWHWTDRFLATFLREAFGAVAETR